MKMNWIFRSYCVSELSQQTCPEHQRVDCIYSKIDTGDYAIIEIFFGLHALRSPIVFVVAATAMEKKYLWSMSETEKY
jgi:TRAP-type mannitol/chloroaromatic compound transport system permease small subunit